VQLKGHSNRRAKSRHYAVVTCFFNVSCRPVGNTLPKFQHSVRDFANPRTTSKPKVLVLTTLAFGKSVALLARQEVMTDVAADANDDFGDRIGTG
jgi:hypothetical protein